MKVCMWVEKSYQQQKAMYVKVIGGLNKVNSDSGVDLGGAAMGKGINPL